MDPIFASDLEDLAELEVHDEKASLVTFQGLGGLRLENGVALLPLEGQDLSIEVWIAAQGPCYPGIVFRADGVEDFEMVYAQPHTSGSWDALQYDPLFHGSNTWQIYHGPAYQRTTKVPIGRWFRLRVDVCGERAAVAVDNEQPLVIERLAHGLRSGRVGIWTYLPACFTALRVWPCTEVPGQGILPRPPQGLLTGWELEGVGPIEPEANGALNLNRYLPMGQEEAHLKKILTLPEPRSMGVRLGFSDDLALLVDNKEVFHRENLYRGQDGRYTARGYVDPGHQRVNLSLPAGEHEIRAVLRVSEPYGWGLCAAAV